MLCIIVFAAMVVFVLVGIILMMVPNEYRRCQDCNLFFDMNKLYMVPRGCVCYECWQKRKPHKVKTKLTEIPTDGYHL